MNCDNNIFVMVDPRYLFAVNFNENYTSSLH